MTNHETSTPAKQFARVAYVAGPVLLVLSALPASYSALWVNFFGALLVAVGGMCGAVGNYDKDAGTARALSWTGIIGGGAAIAGASFRMAVGY